jgi:hypothetical protein
MGVRGKKHATVLMENIGAGLTISVARRAAKQPLSRVGVR